MEIYNSRSEQYKKPFGAVPSGTDIEFHIRPPRSLGSRSVYLCASFEQSGESYEIEMDWIALEEGHDVYKATMKTGDHVGLIWYYFRIESGDRCIFAANDGVKEDLKHCMQITVYDPSFEPVLWLTEGVVYQIFPDRFRRLTVPEAPQGKRIHADWNEVPDDLPITDPDTGEKRWNGDFFGGSLGGITSELDHLKDLGVSVIYMNPIFEAYSNHRYDTGCYERVDPLLGTQEDFEALCREAALRGIRIILDGVFNHTGSDSVYFNREGHYSGPGAYQTEQCRYYPWYSFDQHPNKYAAWWGIDTLPAVNEMEPTYLDYIISNPDSIVRHWLKAGASGWRLDVADELPDEFIHLLSQAAKEAKPDAAVIGEVWEDASNKISYDKRRRHIWGGHLDGVMNYPFRRAVIDFLLGGTADGFQERMETVRENYPPAALANSMNILGTHDTTRILNVLGEAPPLPDKAAQSEYVMPSSTYELAKSRLKLAALILFTFPGVPVIYYGDEAGLYGYNDPFNRKTYPWGYEDKELISWYRELAGFRQKLPPLIQGNIHYEPVCDEVLAYRREMNSHFVWTVVNASAEAQTVSLPVRGEQRVYGFIGAKPAPADGGMVTLQLPPWGGALLSNKKL